jgi:hypothetical protein
MSGLRIQRRCRETGHLVGLYDGITEGMDTDAGRWQTVCEEHGWIISHEKYSTALSWLSHPLEWCDECQREKGLLEWT